MNTLTASLRSHSDYKTLHSKVQEDEIWQHGTDWMVDRFIRPHVEALINFVRNENSETTIYGWNENREEHCYEVFRVLNWQPLAVVKTGQLGLYQYIPHEIAIEGPYKQGCRTRSVDQIEKGMLSESIDFISQRLTRQIKRDILSLLEIYSL